MAYHVYCSQDVGADRMFTPQPSNTSLDSGGSGSLVMGSGGRSDGLVTGPTPFMMPPPRSIVHRSSADSPPGTLNKQRSVSFVRVGSGGRGEKRREMGSGSGAGHRHAGGGTVPSWVSELWKLTTN